MLVCLQSIPSVVSIIEEVGMDIFRGDGFQIRISDASKAINIALAIRAYLRSNVVGSGDGALDARLAVGIGTLDFESDRLSTSDGEAYRLSGRLLDRMDRARLEVSTPWQSVNEELELTTAFADDIISSWTPSQSKIILLSLLTNKNHPELSQELGVTRQTVDKSLRASKEELIKAYIRRFEKIINDKIRER